MLAVLVFAAALRLRGIAWGLPYSFQNVDESVIVAKSFRAARGELNPEFFFYPSLLFYIIAGAYRVVSLFYEPAAGPLTARSLYYADPTALFLIARLVSVTFGVASVYLVYRIGRESYSRWAGLMAALFLAAVPLHVRYSHLAVTDVPATALGLAALLFFLRAARLRDRRALLAGAVVAGLATSVKYNLGMLLVPGALACWYALSDPALRRGPVSFARGVARWLVAPMVAVFFATTPYALLDPTHFVADFYKQNRIVANGWLGFENASNGYWYNLSTNLPGSLGLVLLLLGLAGIAWALRKRTRADVLLVSYVLCYYLYVSSWKELMDRYMLPMIPLLLVLAARACVDVPIGPVARRRVATAAAVGLAALAVMVPLDATFSYSSTLSGADTRLVAKSWVERKIPSGSVIANENYGPPLVTRYTARYFRAAGLHPVAYRVVRLDLPLPGKAETQRDLAKLRRRGVTHVIVSSAVYDRVLAAADSYPKQVRFYWQLATRTDLVKTFTPGPGDKGPTIRVYRL